MEWPNINSFEATIGRLATAEDTHENRASFLLTSNGKRIGEPINLRLPRFAWHLDEESEKKRRTVVSQAEEADGKRYFGGWLLDDEVQIVGFEQEFELLDDTGN